MPSSPPRVVVPPGDAPTPPPIGWARILGGVILGIVVALAAIFGVPLKVQIAGQDLPIPGAVVNPKPDPAPVDPPAPAGSGPTIRLPDGRTVWLGRRQLGAPIPVAKIGPSIASSFAASTLPASADWTPKAMASLQRMYLNDVKGDCVDADRYHSLGIWTGNAAGVPVQATDAEVLATYVGVCGPGDNGCVITEVLDYAKSTGIVAGGKRYRVADYAAFDYTNPDAVKTAIILCGTVTIGVNLPQVWVNSRTWGDIRGPFAVAGGHDVVLVSYAAAGPDASSWGSLYHVTWAAMADTRIVEEAYAVVGESWFGPDGLSPAGFDRPTTLAKLDMLRKGQLPTVTPPPVVPPPPPAPPKPDPPAPKPTPAPTPLTGTITLSGTVTLDAPAPSPQTTVIVPINGVDVPLPGLAPR